MAVTVSNHRHGARPVTLILRFNGLVQCGTVAGSPLVLTLPAQARVPGTIPPQAVLVNGLRAGRVAVSGRRLTITPKHPPVVCTVLMNGPIVLALTRGARIGNPARAGTYVLTVRRGTTTVRGTMAIR